MGNPTIHPDVFARSMETHWQDTLGNVTSPSLLNLWETMGKAFNGAIAGTGDQWTVLQPPTGTGKTQGLAVYSALTAKANQSVGIVNGILIVTRLIEQAEELKQNINRLAGFDCAVAKHSDNQLSLE
jgi:Rad3-related DNA helicase